MTAVGSNTYIFDTSISGGAGFSLGPVDKDCVDLWIVTSGGPSEAPIVPVLPAVYIEVGIGDGVIFCFVSDLPNVEHHALEQFSSGAFERRVYSCGVSGMVRANVHGDVRTNSLNSSIVMSTY